MSLSHIDCHLYRGTDPSPEVYSYVVLNPSGQPGRLVLAASLAGKGSLSGQVASTLSVEHFVDGICDFFEDKNLNNNEEKSLRALEVAFKNANSSVYAFGHKLAAGGKMSASLTGFVIDDTLAAAGRVGSGGVYLYRDGELFSFFTENSAGTQTGGKPLLGSHTMVAVDLASVPLKGHDLLLIMSHQLNSEEEQKLSNYLSQIKDPIAVECNKIFSYTKSDLSFGLIVDVGPESIYLSHFEELI